MNLAVNQVYVKVCGLTSLEDAQAAVDAGADLLGFIFYEKSPRHVTPKQVEAITRQLDCSVLVVKPPDFVTSVIVDES